VSFYSAGSGWPLPLSAKHTTAIAIATPIAAPKAAALASAMCNYRLCRIKQLPKKHVVFSTIKKMPKQRKKQIPNDSKNFLIQISQT
tara:strand:+ start:1162 stop:1422 length:261 start_codon:yes stop_codon:yes gene_type:complete